MYQDYTAILLMLLTAIPLAVVAGTIFFYIRNNDRKTPLKREIFIAKDDVGNQDKLFCLIYTLNGSLLY
jgi:hypothetical protein